MSKAIRIEDLVFTDLNEFSKEAAKRDLGVDVASLLSFTGNYLKELPNGLVMKVVDYDDEPNRILLFFDNATLVYSCKPILRVEIDQYKDVLQMPHGLTTVLGFLALIQSVDSFKRRREKLMEDYRALEENFEEKRHRELLQRYEEYYGRLEDLSEMLLKLEERSIPQIETRYVSFDYSILLAEVNNFLDRARTRISMLEDLAFGHEMHMSRQLSERVENLSDVVKKLTALTVILMVPNVLASHFGMNFRFMPELEIAWAYPAIVVSQIVISLVTLLVFRKKGWI